MSGLALAPRRDNRLLALLAAVLLHAGVLALVLFVPSKAPPPIGSSVPINIVSSEPTDTRPAVQAPQPQAAAAPTPTPEAPPQPPAPVVAPPSFSRPAPQPKPTPVPPKPAPTQAAVHPTPAPARPAPVQPAARPAPQPAVDFNRLQQIIDNARRQSGPAASSAEHGPPRVETAPQARPDAGHALSQSDITGLSQLLERLWTLQCSVSGVSSVAPFKVKFVVDLSGNLLGQPNASGLENVSDPVTASVARRALDAVRAVVPLPQQYYGQTVIVNFNASEACKNRS